MLVDRHYFGKIEHHGDNIQVIVVDQGLEIDRRMALTITKAIEDQTDQPSIVLVDRRNDYSYSGEGMQTLSDRNLPHVVATGIVVYSSAAMMLITSQIGTMKLLGRSNIKVFYTLTSALSWAKNELA